MVPTSHPILLLHGTGLDASMWDGLVADLERRGIPADEVHRFDLLGHAGTPRPSRPLHLDDYVRQAQRYLVGNDVERPVVVGHSLGGLVALALARALTEAVAGAVVIGVPFARSDDQRSEWLDIIMAVSETDREPGDRLGAVAGQLADRWLGPGNRRRQWVVDRLTALDPVTFGLVFRIAMTSEAVVEEMAPEIAVPVVVAAGDADREVDAVGVDELARALPAGSAHVLPGHTHLSVLDAPDDFVALLDRLF